MGKKKPKNFETVSKKKPDIKDDYMLFSFKYFDRSNSKFSTDLCKKGYLERFLDRIQHISNMTDKEFLSDRSSLKAHGIDWNKSTESGFPVTVPSHLHDYKLYQFGIDNKEHGRVHGIIIDHLFFVIWIDPDHKLCPL
jgi:hypothetical protein